jgi:2-hydroxy-3-keto-5-methylthiopentenyl-1-phosphate phosphatase
LKNFKLKIFCDFDGTLTKNDVWVNSLGKFIKAQDKFNVICDLFNNLQITAKQCLTRELALVENFDFKKFNGYLDNEELDDYAKRFLDYCKENNFDVFIISEGLDYYIHYILKKEDLDLKVYCNKLLTETGPGGKIMSVKCEFPYSDENCEWCGMSKRNILISNTNDFENEISVFIGDGTSDSCIANYADIVFAKKSLASYCWKNNITYFEYTNFLDVMNKLNKLIEQRKIKQRQISKTNRRDVLLGG